MPGAEVGLRLLCRQRRARGRAEGGPGAGGARQGLACGVDGRGALRGGRAAPAASRGGLSELLSNCVIIVII